MHILFHYVVKPVIRLGVFILDNILLLTSLIISFIFFREYFIFVLIVSTIIYIVRLTYRKGKKYIIFTSSAGGHYTQLNLIMKNIKLDDFTHIKLTERVKYQDKEPNTKYLIHSSRAQKKYPLKTIINIIITMRVYAKVRPKYIISTGVHSTILLMTVASAYKPVKTIYIESFAKITSATMTGDFIYKHNLADLFIVQWPDMLDIFPKAVFGGGVY